jgi:hypothetical protein
MAWKKLQLIPEKKCFLKIQVYIPESEKKVKYYWKLRNIKVKIQENII